MSVVFMLVHGVCCMSNGVMFAHSQRAALRGPFAHGGGPRGLYPPIVS